ncbi:bifunctional phosphoribosylaminoimidazolecarboxamide formyltransferase/IMP cyclohydrolase [Streptococcus intermedius]|uniref:Bifunctional purine biosynthesis protein PurH n=1 Tax=Streptococcus intermedius TaxID=1338 RepID=A0AAD1FIB1_STRIT|nr:bifunctional phosphoribosylaminoimidazolecarboxamide formyltransferase/IMP cyclohydrolase [Streptococcus intermedius]BAW16019.1 bifunctional phosphoribosylaminoimidazolecarboxamide formyltransferase/IMP cyclohydrolase [Streptococcus intermedius]
MTTKRALISVSDKSGIVDFAQELKNLSWEIVSTGGTKAALDKAGIDTIAIDDVTGFPEMMDGRVKTLHPNIHGGLLARRDLDSHVNAMKEHGITPIDLVVVNLYPFKETILKPGVTYADAVENIDIGGPSMLRSAAKNHASVTVVVDPADYAEVLDELSANGETTYETRKRLAAKVFRHTAAYDALIAEYFTAQVGEEKPEKLNLTYDLKQPMRYGENPQQDADFYQKALPTAYSIASAKQLNGKELSFNNIRDADAAIRVIRDFKDRPTVVALKHMNPCGIGQADDIETAWDYAYEADSVSIFGGIVVLNREVDAATAEKMHAIFLEIIIAPSYTDEALAILTTKKKNLRILQLSFDAQEASEAEKEYTGVVGGLLVQNQDVVKESPADWQVVTKRQPTKTEETALEFAWKAIKYVKSNGIIVTNDHMTLGVGPGQTNRVASVRIAIDQAKDRLDGAVLASDAFFPFADNVEEIAAAGIKAIIQPGGSVRDQESIDMADKYGIAMVFTGVRHFRH